MLTHSAFIIFLIKLVQNLIMLPPDLMNYNRNPSLSAGNGCDNEAAAKEYFKFHLQDWHQNQFLICKVHWLEERC